MKNNFDEIIDRKNTKSAKYNHEQFNIPEDTTPLWVADMDFQTPEEVRKALVDTAEHGIFGYSGPDDAYFEAVENWIAAHYGYPVDRNEIIPTPGVVFALAQIVRAFTEPGDSVLIQEPVYYPFRGVIENNGRVAVSSTLVEEDGAYRIDFEDFERQIVDNDVKLFILSNPHNPVGRVYTKEELEKMAQICLKHDVLMVSDEIHADFVYEPHTHVMLATLDEAIKNNSIICTAPSKTFNLAGLQVSNIIIPDEEKRKTFKDELTKVGYGSLSLPAYNACQAAYTYGDTWVQELKEYLSENIARVVSFVEENTPKIKTKQPEGTYLMWLDCRDLGLDDKALNTFFLNEAKMWLDAGTLFGEGGSGFMRINIALPKAQLEKALTQLKTAYQKMEIQDD